MLRLVLPPGRHDSKEFAVPSYCLSRLFRPGIYRRYGISAKKASLGRCVTASRIRYTGASDWEDRNSSLHQDSGTLREVYIRTSTGRE